MESFWVIMVAIAAGLVVFLRMRMTGRRQAPSEQASATRPTLTPEVIHKIDQLIAQDLRIKAIKLLRDHTGLGLQDAKTLIDQWTPGTLPATSAQPIPAPIPRPLSADVVRQIDLLVTSGKKIEAIKLLREHTGSGLKEAKESIDRWIPGSSPR